MAEPPLHSFVLFCFFLAIWFSVGFSSSKRDYPALKSLHFTLYEQDTVNKTAYMIVKGVDTGFGGKNQDFGPFGTLYAFNDPITIKPNSSSKQVGAMEGISMISSLDGLQSINVIKMTLSFKKHRGSISVVGITPNTAPCDMTVVGGTGDFLFVQGYITYSPFHLSLPSSIFKYEFHLYWPPYANSY